MVGAVWSEWQKCSVISSQTRIARPLSTEHFLAIPPLVLPPRARQAPAVKPLLLLPLLALAAAAHAAEKAEMFPFQLP